MAETINKRDLAMHERRRRILNAATTCFVEKGYHQTSVRDIAKRAEVSLGNIYNHFPGKHAMLVGMAELEAEEFAPFAAILNRDSSAVECLNDFIRAYLKYFARRDVTILNLEITTEAMRRPDIAALFLGLRTTLADAMASLIGRGIQDGCFRPTATPIDTAHFILDLVENASCRLVIDGNDPKKQQEALVGFVLAALMISPDRADEL